MQFSILLMKKEKRGYSQWTRFLKISPGEAKEIHINILFPLETVWKWNIWKSMKILWKNTWTWKILKFKISENTYKVTGM